MGGGLKQKSDDYRYIFSKFMDPEEDAYDIESYNAEDIWKDPNREFYKKGYDKRQFKLSIIRLVKKVVESSKFAGLQLIQSGGTVLHFPCSLLIVEASGDTDDAPGGTGAAPTPTASGNPKQAPSAAAGKKTPASSAAPPPKERVVNDEISMALPYNMWAWKDQKNNDRLTCMVLLPVGTMRDMVVPRVSAGGDEISMKYIWPNAMLDVRAPMYMGARGRDPFYDKGHIKVAHFRDSVKLLKRNDEKQQVKSIFRVDTLFTVEEQFTKIEVPSPVSIIKFPLSDGSQAKCLVLEMMGVRDNYHTDNIDEFCCDMDNLSLG
jgi:hypothetical protein